METGMARRLLVAYSKASTFVQTTRDYLLMLKQHLGYDTDYVHVTHGAKLAVDLNEYDVVFNNYCVRHCFDGYVSDSFSEKLKSYRGLKVMAVQDEYDRTNAVRAAIRDLGFHIVLTCVPQASLDYVYPRKLFRDIEFITVFTGYVSTQLLLRAETPKPLAERSIRVGYRGRDIGGRYGQLGFDKFEIGRRMAIECARQGIPSDIAMDEKSRIYGPAWFDFIENCQVMLGSESGSNVFDFDGSIHERYERMKSAYGGRPPSYAEFAPVVAEREKEISMGQISPRIFECAALHTPMVLFRGRYSDAIAADVHYIPLEKDFSNIRTVLERIQDLRALEAMARRAYDDLIGSGRYTYAAVCANLRSRFERRIRELETRGDYVAIWMAQATCAPGVDVAAGSNKTWLSGRETASKEPGALLPVVSSPTGSRTLGQWWGFAQARWLWRLLPRDVRYRMAPVLVRGLSRIMS
jgi:hypothetical protein